MFTRHYLDVNGKERTAQFIKDLDRIVPYLDGHSPTQLWLIDNCKLQIPVAAWKDIHYEDIATINDSIGDDRLHSTA